MDRSAVALVRPTEIIDGVDWARFEARRFPRYDVEYLSRLRAGASYASVVENVRELTRRPELDGRCTVVVDATGVGMPVVEMLRATDLKARVVPVMITGGSTAHRSEGIWFVPRRDLMVQLARDPGAEGAEDCGGVARGRAPDRGTGECAVGFAGA